MADSLVSPADGPGGVVATDKPPSRGQWQTIARLALEAAGLQVPTTRFGATVTIARLRMAIEKAKAR
jgi:hypothetical protein